MSINRQSTKEERENAINYYSNKMNNYLKNTNGILTSEITINFVNKFYLDNIRCLGDRYNNLDEKEKHFYDRLSIIISQKTL